MPGGPDPAASMTLVEQLNATIAALYPAFNATQAFGIDVGLPYIPALSSYVTIFDSEQDLETYVKSTTYGRDVPDPSIHAALVINSGAPNWDYTIRACPAAVREPCAVSMTIMHALQRMSWAV